MICIGHDVLPPIARTRSCPALRGSTSAASLSTSSSAATIASPASLPKSTTPEYLQDLREVTRQQGCVVHAYVLMTNHVHLLMTPCAPGQVSRTLQALRRRYVRYVNDRYHRTGTLWEGRYKSSLVGSDDYLLRCHRYIDLNPLRAGMVADPVDYRWSSHRHHAFGEHDPLLTIHSSVQALGKDAADRRQRYRAMVMETVDPQETDAIRLHLQRQHVYGPDRFRRAIEATLGRTVGPKKIGRPRKDQAEPDAIGAESRL